MSSRFKHPRQIPLETPDNSSDSSDSENEEGKEIQVDQDLKLRCKAGAPSYEI